MSKESYGNQKSIRLKGHDYSQPGAYYITICTENREFLFGDVVNGEMQLNASGEIVREEWLKTPVIRPEIELDEWGIMPDHMHSIVNIKSGQGRPPESRAHGRAPLRRRPRSLSSLVAGFKSVTTKRINQLHGTPGTKIWQRGYHDRVIRNEHELHECRQYIRNNPKTWELERHSISLNPQESQ